MILNVFKLCQLVPIIKMLLQEIIAPDLGIFICSFKRPKINIRITCQKNNNKFQRTKNKINNPLEDFSNGTMMYGTRTPNNIVYDITVNINDVSLSGPEHLQALLHIIYQ